MAGVLCSLLSLKLKAYLVVMSRSSFCGGTAAMMSCCLAALVNVYAMIHSSILAWRRAFLRQSVYFAVHVHDICTYRSIRRDGNDRRKMVFFILFHVDGMYNVHDRDDVLDVGMV